MQIPLHAFMSPYPGDYCIHQKSHLLMNKLKTIFDQRLHFLRFAVVKSAKRRIYSLRIIRIGRFVFCFSSRN